MKKTYIVPDVTVLVMKSNDVIAASGELPSSYAYDPYLPDRDWVINV